MFRESRERVEDKKRPQRDKTLTDEQHVMKIKNLVLKNRQLTIRDLADTIGILRGSVNTVLEDIFGRQLVLLLHDNLPAHTALILRDFFTKNSTHIVPQP